MSLFATFSVKAGVNQSGDGPRSLQMDPGQQSLSWPRLLPSLAPAVLSMVATPAVPVHSKRPLGATRDVSKVASQPRVSWPFRSPQGRSLQTRPWKPSPALGPLAEGLGPPGDVDGVRSVPTFTSPALIMAPAPSGHPGPSQNVPSSQLDQGSKPTKLEMELKPQAPTFRMLIISQMRKQSLHTGDRD